MKRLWAAWRMKYIRNAAKAKVCVLCNALQKNDGIDNLIVKRGDKAFIILNKYPYTSGHIMIAPIQHKANLEELDPQTRAEMMELSSYCMSILRNIYSPQAFNFGANIGEAAGAGVPGHVHLHNVPRGNGETNFLTTIGEVRVRPADLQNTYDRYVSEIIKTPYR